MTNEYEPDYAVPPGEHLQEFIDECGVSPHAISLVSGLSQDTIQGILNTTIQIDKLIAEGLAAATNRPTELWLNLEKNYQTDLERIENLE